jgi:hypothetical protein
MTSSFNAFNQSFDHDDEDPTHQLFAGRDAQIVVIDASASMFKQEISEEDPNSLFITCLSVLERLMLTKIIRNYKDLVSFK